MSDTPIFRTETWLSLVLHADPEHYTPDPAYKFSNDREFVSSDRGTSGIYKSPILTGMDGEILTGMDGETLTGMDSE